MSKWYKLDNAAKIFPPSTTKDDPKTFRLSATLVENIDKKALQEAVNKTVNNIPLFTSTIKKGFFWYYLEQTKIQPIVSEEQTNPCEELNGELLFQVTYYQKRINLEVYHALTDGTGALEFLKSLVKNYLLIIHPVDNLLNINDLSTVEQENDGFEKYYNPSYKFKIKPNRMAYHLKSKRYSEGRLKIIEGLTNVQELIKIAKKYQTTITIYLTSILIKSIIETMSIRDYNKPIVITVPVNLRQYYNFKTMRNFFNVITVKYDNPSNSDLENIISSVSQQFADYLKSNNIKETMNKLAFLEHFFILRLVPLFIKDIVMRVGYGISRKYQTMALSNIGIIKMPIELEKYIDYFTVYTSTDSIQICVCSYKDKISLAFSSHYLNSEIEKNFFRLLSNQGLDITINTNDIKEEDEDE